MFKKLFSDGSSPRSSKMILNLNISGFCIADSGISDIFHLRVFLGEGEDINTG